MKNIKQIMREVRLGMPPVKVVAKGTVTPPPKEKKDGTPPKR